MFKDWPLLIAIALAFIATFSIYQYMKTQQEKMQYQIKAAIEKERQKLENEYKKNMAHVKGQRGRGINVVVAKKDIPAGDVITSEMVELRKVPSSVKAPMSAGTLDAVIGKMAKQDILVGEQVMLNRVISLKAQKGAIINPGTRLVTIQVEQLDLFRFLRPGDHVDIALMFQLPQSQAVTTGLFPDVEIKAINGRISYSSLFRTSAPAQDKSNRTIKKRVDNNAKKTGISIDPNKGTLSFSLPPKEAAILLMASKLGKIEIYPRSSLDPDKTKIPPITADAVLQFALPNIMAKAKNNAAVAGQKKEQKVEKEPEHEAPITTRKVKIRKGSAVQWVEIGEEGIIQDEDKPKKEISGNVDKQGRDGKDAKDIDEQKTVVDNSEEDLQKEGVVNEV